MNLRATEHLIQTFSAAEARSAGRESPGLKRYIGRLEAHRDRMLARQEARADA